MNKEAYRRLVSARTVLIIDHPFFGCLIIHLKLVEALFIPTMATDGKHLFYNPRFVLDQTEEHLIGIIAHEAYHCSYKHHTRMGDRNLDRWNTAADYVINPDLIKAGFKLPNWVLMDSKWDGHSTEEVYNRLPNNPPPPSGGGAQKPDKREQGQQGGNGQGSDNQNKQTNDKGQNSGNQSQGNDSGEFEAPDPGKMGGIIPSAPSWDKNTIASEDARWEMITRQAVAVAKSQNAGTIPGYLERLVGDLEKPRVEWETHLRRFVDESISKDYTWMNPNRRFLHTGLILPGLVPDKLQHIVSVMDTSGSITDKLIQKYAAEKRALMDEGFCDKLTIVYADTKVQNVQVFERGDEIILNPKGGGGTDFRDAFKHIAKNCEDASVILFFTDLLTSHFGEDPGRPVLWLVYGTSNSYKLRTQRVPFGEHVHVQM